MDGVALPRRCSLATVHAIRARMAHEMSGMTAVAAVAAAATEAQPSLLAWTSSVKVPWMLCRVHASHQGRGVVVVVMGSGGSK
jgi:hypothetical protein